MATKSKNSNTANSAADRGLPDLASIFNALEPSLQNKRIASQKAAGQSSLTSEPEPQAKTYKRNSNSTESSRVAAKPQVHYIPDIDRRIKEYKRSRYPLDSILRAIGEEGGTLSSNSYPKVEWQEERPLPRRDTITAAVNVTNVTQVTVTVATPDIWIVGETVGFANSSLQLYVAEKSGNQLTLRALDGTSSFSLNLPANSTIVRLGIGVGEIKGSVDSRYVLPTIQYNFHQKFMATLRISRVRMDLATYDTNTWVRNLERALDDFRSTQELALLRGRRAERTEGGDKIYYMGGIEEFASKTITYSGSLSYNNLISWAEQIFADNNGSPERLLFAGSGVMADLMALPPFSNTLVSQEVDVRDIRFQRLVTNWGTLLVRHHPLLDEIGQRNTAYVVDLAQITKKVFRPLETTEVNVYQSGGDDLFEVRMQEISTLIVAMPDAHAVIRKN